VRTTSFEKVEQYVMGLSPSRYTDRAEWIKVGMAIHSFDSTDRGLALWERFSRQWPQFKEGECAAKWKGFKPDKPGAVSVATLSFMYMQDNGGITGRNVQAVSVSPCSSVSVAPEKPKFWKSVEEAESVFYKLPCVEMDKECLEFLQRDYGLPKELLPHHWTVLELYGRKGIVYQGFDRSGDSVFKWKSLARVEKKPGVWKRDQQYLYGAGSTMDLQRDSDDPMCIVCGEEKALAAYGAGYRAFSPLNGEHPLSEEWCKFIASENLPRIVLANDNDDAGRKANIGTAEALERAGVDSSTISIIDWGNRPKGYDLNDIARTAGLQAVRRALDEAKPWKPGIAPLDLWDIDRLFAHQHDESENLLDNWLLAAGELSLLVGPPGIGKSRIVNQLIFDILLGESNWLGVLPIHRHGLKIVVIQTENGVRRLKMDFGAQLSGVSMEQRRLVRNRLRFHVPISVEDRDLALDDPANVARLTKTIKSSQPDLVVMDPYGDLFMGDNENDAVQSRKSVKAIFQIAQAWSPKTAILLIHHAKSGRAAAAEAVGWDRQAYARGSKALMSIARAQINVAPGDENNRTLVISCGKNNNGREFEPFAVRLDEISMRYRRDEDFSLDHWREQITTRKTAQKASGRKPLVDPSMVLCRMPVDGEEIPMKALVNEIMEVHGLGRRTIYDLIEDMVGQNQLHRRVEQKGNVSRAFLSR